MHAAARVSPKCTGPVQNVSSAHQASCHLLSMGLTPQGTWKNSCCKLDNDNMQEEISDLTKKLEEMRRDNQVLTTKNDQTVELKVEMVGIHEKRLRKCLSKLRGIEKVEVDANSQKVAVTGYAHRNKMLKAVRRGGLKADFWSAQNELLNAYTSASYGSLRFNNFSFF
ncbi:hypothetical protein Vadar_025803 [Vaccinium darrowii]|uniref:Uncharacterized protein n=1 Tax=Vaccinium darrowii TaxID=229202 RepID=A0ACB7Z6B2_9ERIC|nr:hypothetical protein Vadar_025803 [Vaccinium darrowii]